MAAISSMTGFARTEGAFGGRRWAWEARSVNGRALDLKLKLASGCEALEPAVREGVAQRFRRGSLQISLNVARETSVAPVRIDTALVERLLEAGKPWIDAGRIATPSWDGILAVRGVLLSEDAQEVEAAGAAGIEAALQTGMRDVLDALAEARAREGADLTVSLASRCGELRDLVSRARTSAAVAPAALMERLQKRIDALAVDVEPARFAQEAALLASKADVHEELERLDAHVGEAERLLAGGDSAGRRLEFLAQELNREANTLCSKSSEIELTRIGLELKAVIDQVRELSANVE
jgi:uncharacterized protein (TIGR00255 family)